MMNDEFVIDKNTYFGSEGNACTRYFLDFTKQEMNVEMTLEELERLSRFLNDFLKKKECRRYQWMD